MMVGLATLGLGGDGDEVCAIEDAFAALGLDVPIKDAVDWVTVGDVWNSVERIAPKIAGSEVAWDKFRQAICGEACVEWSPVTKETALLGSSLLDFRDSVWTKIKLKFGKSD